VTARLRALLLRAALLAAALAIAAPGAAAADESMADWSVALLAKAKARIETLQQDLVLGPEESHEAFDAARGALMTGAGVRGFTYVMILLFVGIGVEWFFWTHAYASLRALEAAPAPTPREALRLALRRLALHVAALLLFTFAILGTSAAFTWPPGIHATVVAAALLVLVFRLARTVVKLVLSPSRPRLRLVPVPRRKLRWYSFTALTTIGLLAVGHFVPDVLNRIGGTQHAGGALRLVSFTLAALLLAVAAFALIDGPARRRADGAARRPTFPKSFVLAAMALGVYAVWLINGAAAALAAVLAVVVALQLVLRDIVFFFWADASVAEAAESPGEQDPGVLPSIVLSAARFVVMLLAVGAFAIALETPVADLAASESMAVRLGLRALGVATLALLTHVIWIAVRTAIDQRLARIRPVGEPHHGEPDPNARLLTLLPLMRITSAVLLFVMLILSSLWALGIEITPLLAGAGVLGLALGFGAQALVRDVIAGIFYLAEDAFRVGEYIESGTATKGTVERITLRSVALRHHNGPLHFVPYGSLGTVRNTSRDWVIDKFNLPLPIEAESEAVRKMIKKIGEEMKADPVLGPMLMEPLKGKLYRIDPGVKLFRCKFRCPPGKQFDLRAAALKRFEAAMKKAGLQYADGKQTVLLQGSG
jgi:small-conductance mechanosensitive channel